MQHQHLENAQPVENQTFLKFQGVVFYSSVEFGTNEIQLRQQFPDLILWLLLLNTRLHKGC